MIDKKRFVEKNSMLVKEFDKYILEHPEFANQLPDNALVVMQMTWMKHLTSGLEKQRHSLPRKILR